MQSYFVRPRLFLWWQNAFANLFFLKKFYFKLIYFYIFRLFWCADIKNKLKKYYFNIFSNKKYFKKQLLRQTCCKSTIMLSIHVLFQSKGRKLTVCLFLWHLIFDMTHSTGLGNGNFSSFCDHWIILGCFQKFKNNQTFGGSFEFSSIFWGCGTWWMHFSGNNKKSIFIYVSMGVLFLLL